VNISDVNNYINIVKITYNHRDIPIFLATLYKMLYKLQFDQHYYLLARNALLESLSLLKESNLYINPEYYIFIANCYRLLNNKKKYKESIEKAYNYNRMYTGINDKACFYSVFSKYVVRK
jgi:hypothetical protein